MTSAQSDTPRTDAPFRWVRIHTVDELEAFCRSILPAIRQAAHGVGYAIGVHGSMRRDLDLIAVPWTEEHADRDALASAISVAACGANHAEYGWNEKPCGRQATSSLFAGLSSSSRRGRAH
jgi:hypothetical protein